jgi:hypothetical protein
LIKKAQNKTKKILSRAQSTFVKQEEGKKQPPSNSSRQI